MVKRWMLVLLVWTTTDFVFLGGALGFVSRLEGVSRRGAYIVAQGDAERFSSYSVVWPEEAMGPEPL